MLNGTISALAAVVLLGSDPAREPAGIERCTSPLPVSFEVTAEGLRVELDGALFTVVRTGGVPRPCLYPLLAPGGAPVTRGFPIDPQPDEAKDHPHHLSLWFAHGSVNGFDFWHGGAGERIVGSGDIAHEAGDGEGTVRARFEWRDPAGGVVCTEDRTMVFRGDRDTRTIDFDLTLRAPSGPLTFGDTKEGTFALRLAPALRLRGAVAQGRCRNSAGDRDGACWGRRAAWMEYSGPLRGEAVGVAVFDHPGNPRHPTWWHARDYGLFAANPFGVHDFEGGPAGAGDVTLEPGRALRFRYRLLVHAGHWDAERLERTFRDWSGGAAKPEERD